MKGIEQPLKHVEIHPSAQPRWDISASILYPKHYQRDCWCWLGSRSCRVFEFARLPCGLEFGEFGEFVLSDVVLGKVGML